MGNVLLIHMGQPKTGTTTLQHFLYENAGKLGRYGWDYPDLKMELPTAHSYRGIDIAKNGDIFFDDIMKINVFTDNWEKVWECLVNHLKSKNVIVSDETLFYWDTAKFLTGAKQKYDNIKVVIYLRRQDRFIESCWNQGVKNAILCYTQTFHDYIYSEEAKWRLQYEKKLEQISAIIGEENLIVRIYDQELFRETKRTIVSDFLSVLNIEPDLSEWKEGNSFYNPRLSNNFCEIKRIFNSVPMKDEIAFREQYVNVFTILSRKFTKNTEQYAECGYFAPEERKAFLEQFSTENERIARKYLHRKDGVLFYDHTIDYPYYDLHKCTSFEEDLIRLFSMMICSQNEKMEEEIRQLKIFNGHLVKKCLLTNLKNRQLVLFGAGGKCKELLNAVELPITWILDNDEQKRGYSINGIRIIHPRDIDDWSEYFVAVTCLKTDEIEGQLSKLGLKKGMDYVCVNEYL